MQNLKKKWFFVSKMIRIWRNLTWAHASLQKLHFYLLLLCKVFNVWPKTVQRSYLSWHWKVMQNLKKNLWCGKWHEEYVKFSLQHLKVSKLGLWWNPLIQSRKSMSLKSKRSYVSWQWRMIQKLKRNWLVVLKFTWGTSQILTRAFESLQQFLF